MVGAVLSLVVDAQVFAMIKKAAKAAFFMLLFLWFSICDSENHLDDGRIYSSGFVTAR